jgi:integrase
MTKARFNGAHKKRVNEPSEKFTTSEGDSLAEARISSHDEQLALGAYPHGQDVHASQIRKDSSVGSRGHKKRGRRSLGRFPFLTAVNDLLRETNGFYSKSTAEERRRKLVRVYAILSELKESGRIASTSPLKIVEADVVEFIAWCKIRLDSTTSAHYLRFLDEVLQSVGNSSAMKVRMKRKNLIPHVTPKAIRTLAEESSDVLLSGAYSLEDEWWDAIGKAAIALYSHSGMRVSELRSAKLTDLDMRKGIVIVSCPKGKGRWANSGELAPIMPGIENVLQAYLDARDEALRNIGLNPMDVEPLFPFISKGGKVGYWQLAMWEKLKIAIEKASGVSFRWKDFRPTFAQKAKDLGASIEVVSKSLRHTSTRTTELYYARIRSETAFSQMRQVWEASVAKFQSGRIEN